MLNRYPRIISQFSKRDIIANQVPGLQGNIDICIYCYYDKYMGIEFDQIKRDITLQQRGLDFARAGEVFASVAPSPSRISAGITARRDISPSACWISGLWFWSGRHAVQLAASFL